MGGRDFRAIPVAALRPRGPRESGDALRLLRRQILLRSTGSRELHSSRPWPPTFQLAQKGKKQAGHQHRLTGGHFTHAPSPSLEKEREAAKLARRKVNNKAWDACTPVRRAWLPQLAQRKAAPAGAEALIAATAARTGGFDMKGWEDETWRMVGIDRSQLVATHISPLDSQILRPDRCDEEGGDFPAAAVCDTPDPIPGLVMQFSVPNYADQEVPVC